MGDNILIGNGAAELIKALMNILSGKIGFVRPTFEEYPNRYDEENSVIFTPDNKNFAYTVYDIMDFFDKVSINNLVIVNPDNPSGNYLPKKDILVLLNWANKRNITLVLDESFIDFAEEEAPSIIEQKILDDVPEKLEGDFELYKAFENVRLETVLLYALKDEAGARHYLDNLRKIKISVTGKDLQALGIKPSPKYQEIFDMLLMKKLANPLMTKDDEIAHLKFFENRL